MSQIPPELNEVIPTQIYRLVATFSVACSNILVPNWQATKCLHFQEKNTLNYHCSLITNANGSRYKYFSQGFIQCSLTRQQDKSMLLLSESNAQVRLFHCLHNQSLSNLGLHFSSLEWEQLLIAVEDEMDGWRPFSFIFTFLFVFPF